MSQPPAKEIDKKWVQEDNHIFSVYPSVQLLGHVAPVEEETWLELAQFYHNDLLWLLSLDHHQFWSLMIYSDRAHQFLLSFLKESPPTYLKSSLLLREDMWKLQSEIEHLVFLVYMRLCSKNEAVKNLGEILYNNYLFTVPVLLDICLTYGASNQELVQKMINEVITLAPDFTDDLKEIVPYFFRVLRLATGKFSVERLPKLMEKPELKASEVKDFVYFLHDSVATIEIFLELYPKGCDLFRTSEHVVELVYFYSNVLPEIRSQSLKIDSELCELVENTRVDLLKIVKSIFDFVLSDKGEESVDEYLTLMMELLPEPTFLSDYNSLFSLEFEIELAVKNCPSVDTIKIKHILDSIDLSESKNKEFENATGPGFDYSSNNLDSLVREVKDIFPDLETDFVKRCLKYYDYNTERVITAILENSVPAELNEAEPQVHKPKHEDLRDVLNDREEVNEVRGRYAELSYVDDTFDDEYDDTYDVDVAVREIMEESVRRPFVTPRVLRGAEEDEEDDEGEEEEEQEEEKQPEANSMHFVENPEVVRERMRERRGERRDVAGRGRGQGQSKQVTRNREYKEAHKSRVANHNRKKQASRKTGRGMIPF